MSELEQATAVQRVGNARYRTHLQGDWGVGRAMNGGYLQLPVARAVLAEAGAGGWPCAVTTNFLSPPLPGPGEITVTPLRQGRQVGTFAAQLVQQGEPRLQCTVVTGELSERDVADVAAPGLQPPAVEPLEHCTRVPAEGSGGVRVGLMDHVEVWLDGPSHRALGGDGSLSLTGYMRMADGTPTDPLVCLLAADSYPPVSFTTGNYGWAPTVQLTTYLRRLPDPGALRARLHGNLAAGGWFDEECVLFDASGAFVAQSRQLARIPKFAAAR